MGLAASFLMGKGSPTTQMMNFITGSLYSSFIKKETSTFPEFHEAFLDIFSTFNSALPGKHYDAPSPLEVEEFFEQWKNTDDGEKRKQMFVDFIKENVSTNKPERLTVITGLVTPPAAMVAKKAGERVPALKMIKVVPDVLFIPSATFIALISVKVSQNVFHRKVVRQDQQKVSLQRRATTLQRKATLQRKTSEQQTNSEQQTTSE
ncbi:Protein furry-like protein [Bienertia sinuspersici]